MSKLGQLGQVNVHNPQLGDRVRPVSILFIPQHAYYPQANFSNLIGLST